MIRRRYLAKASGYLLAHGADVTTGQVITRDEGGSELPILIIDGELNDGYETGIVIEGDFDIICKNPLSVFVLTLVNMQLTFLDVSKLVNLTQMTILYSVDLAGTFTFPAAPNLTSFNIQQTKYSVLDITNIPAGCLEIEASNNEISQVIGGHDNLTLRVNGEKNQVGETLDLSQAIFKNLRSASSRFGEIIFPADKTGIVELTMYNNQFVTSLYDLNPFEDLEMVNIQTYGSVDQIKWDELEGLRSIVIHSVKLYTIIPQLNIAFQSLEDLRFSTGYLGACHKLGGYNEKPIYTDLVNFSDWSKMMQNCTSLILTLQGMSADEQLYFIDEIISDDANQVRKFIDFSGQSAGYSWGKVHSSVSIGNECIQHNLANKAKIDTLEGLGHSVVLTQPAAILSYYDVDLAKLEFAHVTPGNEPDIWAGAASIRIWSAGTLGNGGGTEFQPTGDTYYTIDSQLSDTEYIIDMPGIPNNTITPEVEAVLRID